MKALLIPHDGPPREVDFHGAGGTGFMPWVGKLIGTYCAERIWITTRRPDQGDIEGAKAAYQQAIDSGHLDYAPMAANNLAAPLADQGDI